MLVTIATLKIKAGQEAEFERIALELTEEVAKNEEGCLQYTLCKGAEPGVYMFVERYRDEAAVEAHRKSDHFRRLGREMGSVMDGAPEIQRLTQLSS